MATAELRELIQPTSLAAERRLPVIAPLVPLLPSGGLVAGSTVGVDGCWSLALALVAGASGAGSWVAVVGTASVGWASAAELGIDLSRTFVVPDVAAGDWPAVMAMLIGTVDVVMASPRHPVRERDARRLAARARERGTVLVVVDARAGWPIGPDVVVEASGRWSGLGMGHGRLRARRVSVTTSGRRAAARPQSFELWLPATDGSVRPALGPSRSVPQPHTPVSTVAGQNELDSLAG